jgi:hypothetical protein
MRHAAAGHFDRFAPKVLKLVGEGQSYREFSHRLGLSNSVLDIAERTARHDGLSGLIERCHEGAYRIRLGHHIRMTQTRDDRHRHIGTLRLELGLQLLSVEEFV